MIFDTARLACGFFIVRYRNMATRVPMTLRLRGLHRAGEGMRVTA
jgi:hypothetical protein